MATLRIILAALLLLTGLCACQKHDASHPLFIRAQKLLLDNDFQEAAKCYSQYLELFPQSPDAHKAIGTIYDDRLKAPVLAIYHYRKFLEYAPKNHPDRVTVTRWIETIEQKYYIQLKDRYNDPDDLKSTKVRFEIASEELAKLKPELEQYRSKLTEAQERIKQDTYFIAKLKQQNAAMMKESAAARQTCDEQTQRSETLSKNLTEVKNINAILHQDVARLRDAAGRLKEAALASLKELENTRASFPPGPWRGVLPHQEDPVLVWLRTYEADPLSPVAMAAALERTPTPQPTPLPGEEVKPVNPAAATAPAAAVHTQNGTTYTVRSGDTLSGISKKFYGSSRYTQRILDANKKALSDPTALRSGQVLEIPAANSN